MQVLQITGLVTWSAHGSSSCCQLLWPDSTSGYLHNLVDTHTVEFKVTMDCFDCCDLCDYILRYQVSSKQVYIGPRCTKGAVDTGLEPIPCDHGSHN